MQTAELEDLVKVLEGKVKELTERLRELDSPELTEEEIRDVEASLKEIKEGKGKRFHNAEDAIRWLRSDS